MTVWFAKNRGQHQRVAVPSVVVIWQSPRSVSSESYPVGSGRVVGVTDRTDFVPGVIFSTVVLIMGASMDHHCDFGTPRKDGREKEEPVCSWALHVYYRLTVTRIHAVELLFDLHIVFEMEREGRRYVHGPYTYIVGPGGFVAGVGRI